MWPHGQWRICSGSLLVSSVLASAAHAFDGKGKGFIFGLGVGPNFHRISESFDVTDAYIYYVDFEGNTHVIVRRQAPPRPMMGTSVTFELQLGYGFTEKLLVYVWDREEIEVQRGYNYVEVFDRTALLALGFDYRLGPDAGPWFLSAGLGESYLHRDHVGWGAFAGVGRDLGRMSQLRFQLSYGQPSSKGGFPSQNYDANTLHAILVLGMLWR